MKSWKLLRECTFGATAPRGWGMAWYEPQRRVKICAPVPLHWVARWAREVWWRVGLALSAPDRERHESREMQCRIRESQRLAQEYARGYLAGWRECRKACLEAAESGAIVVASEADLREGMLGDLELFAATEEFLSEGISASGALGKTKIKC